MRKQNMNLFSESSRSERRKKRVQKLKRSSVVKNAILSSLMFSLIFTSPLTAVNSAAYANNSRALETSTGLGSASSIFMGTYPIEKFTAGTINKDINAEPTVSENDEQEVIIEITSATDFENFALGCKSDAYSSGVTFCLMNDIYISTSNFDGVPYFNGTFDGNGHKLSFSSISPKGSHYGFFRYIGASGVVKNLNISGDILAEGSQNYIGGIAGVNDGIICNCSFEGNILGEDSIGGICGINKNGAVISDCRNSGNVLAKNYSGGICGRNEGTITHCSNTGSINTEELDSSMDIGAVDVGTLNITQNVMNRNDMGGIAGHSSGVIRLCENYGTIGFMHTGYNVGGIVGCQNGVVITCYNYGEVYGRKDVGGIVGQAEPFIESDYLKDKVDSTQEELNQLNDTLSGIASSMGDTSEETRRYAEELNDQYNQKMETVSANVTEVMETVSENHPEAQEYIDNINEAMDKIDNLNISKEYLEQQDVKKYIEENGKLPEDIPEELKQYLPEEWNGKIPEDWDGKLPEDYTKDLPDNLPESVKNDLTAIMAIKVLEEIQSNMKVVNENLEEIYKLYESDRETTENAVNNISEEFKNSNEAATMEEMIATIDDGMQEALTGFESAINQTNDIVNNVSNDLNMVLDNEEGVIDDISSVETSKDMSGVISLCVNNGKIFGDLNVGGIAGAMNIEYDADPEYDLDITDSTNITIRTTVNDVVIHCRNNAAVSSKKNDAGGIVGQQEMGFIYNCQSYGEVSADDGSNLGGIVGYSASCIQKCYSFCRISGNDYVGGIVGDGYTVKDSVAICMITSKGECLGAIAGYLEKDGTSKNNYFVSEENEGIDGISYAGIAEHKTYDEVMAMSGIPYAFHLVTVEFWCEDELLSELQVRYGSVLDKEDYPVVAEKDDSYVVWRDELVRDGVYSNVSINAEYIPWKNSVAGPVTIAVNETQRVNAFLVAGNFYEGTRITMNEITGPNIDENEMLGYAYEWTIDNPNAEILEGHFYGMGDVNHASVYVLENDSWKVIPSTVDGSYLVAQIPVGTPFAVVVTPPNYFWVIVGSILGVLMVLFIIVKTRNIKKKKADRSESVKKNKNKKNKDKNKK